MKTWHLEALFSLAVLTLAWSWEQAATGSVDALSALGILAAHLGLRAASISSRVSEHGNDPRTAAVECWPKMAHISTAMMVVSLLMALSSGLDGRALTAAIQQHDGPLWWTLSPSVWMATGVLTGHIPALAIAGLTLRACYPLWRKLYRRLQLRSVMAEMRVRLTPAMSNEQHGLVTQLVERLEAFLEAWRKFGFDSPSMLGYERTIAEKARDVLARATPEAVRKADAAPEMLAVARRALDVLDEAGNYFDHVDSVAAQEVLARYFELWAEDDRAAIAKTEGRA